MNIRICEWKDAERMLQDGTFAGFVQMWLDRYPGRGRMKQVKEYKKMFGCPFDEASRLWHYCPPPRDIDFEIGDDYVLRRDGDKYRLLHRKNGVLTGYKEKLELKDIPCVLVDPARVRYHCACEKRELMEAGRAGTLCELAQKCLDKIYRLREYKVYWTGRTVGSPFLFCEEEIWRLDWDWRPETKKRTRWGWYMTIRIARKSGEEEEIEGTREAVLAYLEKYYERLEITRGAF